MKNTSFSRSAFLALLLCLLSCLPLMTAPAAADTPSLSNIGGNAESVVSFYVYAAQNATLTFTQEKGRLLRQTGWQNNSYGGYDIAYYTPGKVYAVSSETFYTQTLTLHIPAGSSLMFTVTPYTLERMRVKDAHLGYPGNYTRWILPAAWSLSASAGCTVAPASVTAVQPGQAGTAVPTATPAPSATINVYYRLTDGTLISSATKVLRAGVNTVSNELNSATYSLVSPASYTVTVYANGTLSQPSVTFYFLRGSAATPRPTSTPTPRPVTVTVYYMLQDGTLLATETRQLMPGTNTLYCDMSYISSGALRFVGPASHQVTVYSNGTVSTNSVAFYFDRNQATAAPAAATVTVYYRLTDGTLLSSEQKTLGVGTHTITSGLQVNDLTLLSAPSYTVTVNAAGTPSAGSVTFYYDRKSSTAAPMPTSANVTVYYRLTDGTLLSTEQRTLEVGAHTVTGSLNVSGLSQVGTASYTVTVNANGTVSPGSVTFYYSRNSAAATAVPVTAAPFTPIPGGVSTPLPDTSSTDQQATVAYERIYPRPRPGDGKNEYNYLAQGQTVTVHSKAISLKKNDNNWWVCISGKIKCWGQTFTIDHEWIRADYLNSKSYDFDRVPLDPQYGSLQ